MGHHRLLSPSEREICKASALFSLQSAHLCLSFEMHIFEKEKIQGFLGVIVMSVGQKLAELLNAPTGHLRVGRVKVIFLNAH